MNENFSSKTIFSLAFKVNHFKLVVVLVLGPASEIYPEKYFCWLDESEYFMLSWASKISFVVAKHIYKHTNSVSNMK